MTEFDLFGTGKLTNTNERLLNEVGFNRYLCFICFKASVGKSALSPSA
jgi:hypothetical protein